MKLKIPGKFILSGFLLFVQKSAVILLGLDISEIKKN